MQSRYGIEKFGRLKTVLLHRPEASLKKVTEENRGFFLFDRVPDVDRYLEEHQSYGELLASQGVKVLELGGHVRRNL